MSVHSVPSAPADLKDEGFLGPGGERCKLEEPGVKKMAGGGRGECSGKGSEGDSVGERGCLLSKTGAAPVAYEV